MNNVFDIIGLGRLTFLISIIDFDYPRTFVCKKTDSESLELFLFDEINHGDDYVEWACVQTTADDLDRLNNGLTTLENLFYGPRKSKKTGYKVVSKNDGFVAKAYLLEDVSCLIVDNQTYVAPFIEDNHGVSLMSLLYEKPIIGIIVKPEKFADPMIDTTRVSEGSNHFKAMLNTMPYAIETRNNRMAFSQIHSLVMYFEVADKQLVSMEQGVFSDKFLENSETHSAFKAIKSIIDEQTSSEQIIDAFKGDKKSIEKAGKFLTEIKRNNKNTVSILAADYSYYNSEEKNILSCDITNQTVKVSNEKLIEVAKIIDDESKHEFYEFTKVGQFLMLDTTGRKRFKFQSIEKDDDGTIYSGFSDVKISGFSVDDNRNKRYKVTIKTDILHAEFGASKPVYTLIKIEECEQEKAQVELF